MNEYREEGQRWCYFHPRDLVIGVCALCLNERLLVLASKQAHIHQTTPPRKVLPKIFTLTGLINPLYIIHHNKSDDVYDDSNSSICSQEDSSYISMKFEDNRVASWDKGRISNSNSLEKANRIKSVVVEQAKPRSVLRWRNRIGHLVNLIRWKRTASKGGVCQVGTKLEGSKVKYGWIRILTKRRTEE